jgi:pimeloyl-ACP methyl ester carboxylesterase
MRATRRSFIAAVSAGAAALPLAGERGAARANLPVATRRRGYADGPYGLVHYYDTGAAGRPLLMFHQAPMSARQFDRVYEPLAKRGIRAIGVDMPGFGMSDPTSFVPKVEDWAKVAPALLDHLRIEQCDVLGHHTGAMVATEVGVQYPQRVRSLVVNGPMPMGDEERAKRLEGQKTSEIDFEYKADGSHMAASFQTRWRMYGGADGANTGAIADPKLITRYTVEKFQGFGPFWYGHYAAFKYDHEKGLRALKVRTLLLTNTGDMIYGHCQAARRMRPDFAYAELAGGGVDIVDQQPEAWCDVVAKFLRG